jgi:Na+/glutamate symporter
MTASTTLPLALATLGPVLCIGIGLFVAIKVSETYPDQEPNEESQKISSQLIRGSIPNKYWQLPDYILFFSFIGAFLILGLAFFEMP